MKGNPELIDKLNYLLAGEITAINQYMVHAEMCEDWGFEKLSKNFKERAVTEMHHAEHLIERILFLEGKPIVSNINELHIGSTVPDIVNNDHASEIQTCKDYNDAIALAVEVKDNATKELLEGILKQEDEHVDELEDLQDEIEMMKLENFLTTQM